MKPEVFCIEKSVVVFIKHFECLPQKSVWSQTVTTLCQLVTLVRPHQMCKLVKTD